MANMMKKSSFKDIGHLDMHYKRGVEKGHYGNPDIDQERLDEDKHNFAPMRYQKDENGNFILDENGRKIEQKMTDYIKETADQILEGRTLRKDAVRMVCWVVDAPKYMTDSEKAAYFQGVYNFCTNRYGKISGMGEDIVLSCYWHRSETTDHIHYSFMPIIDRDGHKNFCAKEVVGRQDLKTFHQDLENYLVKRGLCKKGDILNGNTIRDSTGRALSVRELKYQDYKRERDAKDHASETSSRWDQTISGTKDRDMQKGRW